MRLLRLILLMATCVPTAAQDLSGSPKESLRNSCMTEPFVSVSVSTPKHDAVPAVKLTLTDPHGRTAGVGAQRNRIPTSRYGKVTEIPTALQRSLVLAVEVCDAQQGDYHIKIDEHDSDPYRLSVSAEGGSSKEESVTMLLHHIARDRTLQYVFAFRIDQGHVVLRWVDGEGRELPPGRPLEIDGW